jgi:cyclase
MLKTRVIPLLLLKDGLLCKPVQFVKRPRTIANPISIISVFEARQVDELILLDIGCANGHASVNPDIVRMAAEVLTVPFTCGGGIRDLETIVELIAAGAEKITLNTAAIETPDLIRRAADKFGSQCIVVSIDAKRLDNGEYETYIHNGRKLTPFSPIEIARQAEQNGAGELLITSIDRDGTMTDFDVDLIRLVTCAVNIPVIAAGGAGDVSQFSDVVIKGGASAVAAGSIYHFRSTTPQDVKDAMHNAGIPVRL